MTDADRFADASDATVVVAISRFRADALAEAFRRHGGAIHRLARRMLNDEALAEEITQEVFLRLWDRPDRFDPGRGTLRSYLLAQTHGRAVDLIRSETARRRREERESARAAPPPYEVEHEVWDLVVAEQVGAALAALPAGERAAIQLAYFEGLTYREVARRLGEPEGTIKTRIRRGLRRLRDELAEAGVGSER